MPRRAIEVEGETWNVTLSGRVTSYSKDEVGIVFARGTGADAIRKVVRFRPLGSQRANAALSELSDAQLRTLLGSAQPAWTSPELEYRGGPGPG